VEGDRRAIKSPAQSTVSGDWPALLARIVDDLARIVQTEIRIFQAALTPIFSNAIDRLLANAVALAAYIAAGVCLLIAFVFFLHQWLAWAPALAITGLVSLILGYLSSRIAAVHAKRSLAELEQAFDHMRIGARSHEGVAPRSPDDGADAPEWKSMQ